MHEIAAIAKAGRTRLGSLPLLQQEAFQRDYGFHHSAVTAARLLVKQSFRALVDSCQPEQPPDLRFDFIRTAMADSAYAVRVAKAATVWAFETSGSSGIRNPNKLQRCFRDICVGAGHQVFDDRNFVQHTQQLLGIEESS
jgi:alkylation response protein AidB-like acyl-CoA dehydrogenase